MANELVESTGTVSKARDTGRRDRAGTQDPGPANPGGPRPNRRRRTSQAGPIAPPDAAGTGETDAPNSAPEEIAARRRAIALVGDHWPELSIRLARWLGQAYYDNNDLPSEVALILMRRYGNGHGRLVAHLRRLDDGDAFDTKAVLFGEAKWAYREVLSDAVTLRDWTRRLVEVHSGTSVPAVAEPFAFVDHDPTWAVDTPAQPITFDSDDVNRFIEAIEVLLACGEEVWESFCHDGLLNATEWTDDQKWTAIGLMWDFTVEQIAAIRRVKVSTNVTATTVTTMRMISTIRSKGERSLEAMPQASRRRHNLVGRRRRRRGQR